MERNQARERVKKFLKISVEGVFKALESSRLKVTIDFDVGVIVGLLVHVICTFS